MLSPDPRIPARLFELVLEGTDVGITVMDHTGALVYANAAAATIIGFETPGALLAARTEAVIARFETFHFDGRPFATSDLPTRRALRGEAPEEIHVRFRIVGTYEERWSVVRSVPVRDDAGAVSHVINFFREVTEEQRAEHRREFLMRAARELGASLDYEQTLASVARLAVPALADWCAVDLAEDGVIRRVAIAHVDPDKVRFVEELQRKYPPDPAAPSGVPNVLRTGQAEMLAVIPPEMIRAASRDAEHLRLIDALALRSYMCVPLIVGDRPIGAITFVMAESGRTYGAHDLDFARSLADRAALAIANARLFQQTTAKLRQAEETARFAEMFTGILGHDLRNPLNAVAMAAAILRRQVEGESKPLARIEASTRRMSSMVDQLLDLTRIRLAGGIVVDRQRSDLTALISAVIDELALAHPGREIRWTHTPCDGVWDAGRLAQVVSNLVGNALEHGDAAHPVTVSVTTCEGDGARLAVHSHGEPIPAHVLPQLFEPYRERMRGNRSRGLGLGLFITQQIVHAHGGTITVESSDEHGTTFTVTLPRQEPK